MPNCESMHTCQVIVPVPLRQYFDYSYHQPITPGSRVLVPFAQRKLVGIVLSNEPPHTTHQLKKVTKVLDQEKPTFDAHLIHFLHWASDYYHHPCGEVFHAALPTLLRTTIKQVDPRLHKIYCAHIDATQDNLKNAPLQRRILAFLMQTGGANTIQIGALCKNWRPSLQSLQDKNLVTIQTRLHTLDRGTPINADYILTDEQKTAIDQIEQLQGNYATLLLQGVTGSGKTEVYLQSAARVIQAGGQVLCLVPEIALTPQWVTRVRQRLGDAVVTLHSGLTNKQRYLAWWQARCGDASAVLGTRSAIFTPMPKLGLIIVDEEHDLSFKQQDGFRYNARDLAIKRANMESIPIVLGSATPALESLHNSRQRHYHIATLKQRTGTACQPDVGTIDTKSHPLTDGLSQPMRSAIAKCLAKKEQIILFLNRRGFSPLVQCYNCGWQASCQRCDAFLVLHKSQNQLRCHHCGHNHSAPNNCPQCENSNLYHVGIGTQRIDKALTTQFPQARVLRLDRDQIKTQQQLEYQLERIHMHQVDILVGTQLIAKGHDFPAVTLVGVVNADQGLYSIDFRSREHLFQQLLQVGGRAGRAQRHGTVLIQTAHPEDSFFYYLRNHNYEGYANMMMEERQQANLPPFKPLALLRAESTYQIEPIRFLKNVADRATELKQIHRASVEVFDPVPSPMIRRAGRYRAQLLLRGDNRKSLHKLLDALLTHITQSKYSRRIRWSLDIDPVNLF